eukprot:CAMPEP_0113960468 /NCGR_PEP_ID=MMETSP0011_2-20120614/4728_1 /TAXON_ID=101924 /ORGANISM="Rhodosorus marinus" /LENGTH=78 /DNA_ID=CAMNT_0000971917 /DNA_START=1481 /DNA_END=1717 /DNA_ORIENTATION=- /assembly_acc=CAM_ASM_000156
MPSVFNTVELNFVTTNLRELFAVLMRYDLVTNAMDNADRLVQFGDLRRVHELVEEEKSHPGNDFREDTADKFGQGKEG